MASPLDLVRAWVDAGTVPGVAACVVDRSGVIDEAYAGVRVARGDEPVGPGTRFALASLTKPLTAAACMCAVEEGLLELDEEVRDGFTLRHLLSHCSGLAADSAAIDAPLVDPPGTYRRYSNAGYALAGRLVERAAEMPFGEYLRAAVLDPLGMDASLGLDPSDAGRAAIVREPGLWADGEPFFNSDAFRAAALGRERRLRDRSGVRSLPRVPARRRPCGRRPAARGRDRRRDALHPVRRAARDRRGPRDVGRVPVGSRPRRAGHARAALDGRRADGDREHPLRQLGRARLDRPRARARSRRAREPQLLLGLVVASRAAGPTSRLRSSRALTARPSTRSGSHRRPRSRPR